MGKFDKYKIDLKGMQADSAKYEFVLDNLYFAHIDGPEVQKGKVNVTLTVKRTSRAFELSFQTDGMVWVPAPEGAGTAGHKVFRRLGGDICQEDDGF